MLLVDANVILRYILYDNEEMADQVDELLKDNVVTIRNEVLAEVVYVLDKVYKLPRTEIHEVLILFLDLENVKTQDRDVVVLALETFSQSGLDFVDTLLYAYHVVKDAKVFTFDKKLLSKIKQHPENKRTQRGDDADMAVLMKE
ncbi:MAG: PIN domain-containing protein [Defluviitaleaceae bacterium]|nr:PIN domain-containing protein [Defluviitaleaceae bacterium]MCL2262899.1 PIN domain-containing protein [Defluviitaleaceae bacterium]